MCVPYHSIAFSIVVVAIVRDIAKTYRGMFFLIEIIDKDIEVMVYYLLHCVVVHCMFTFCYSQNTEKREGRALLCILDPGSFGYDGGAYLILTLLVVPF